MDSVSLQIAPLRRGLLSVGFREDRLRTDFLVPGSQLHLPLLAFSDQPFDSRTASIAILDQANPTESDIASLRPLGAPLVFNCLPGQYQLWTQGSERPRFHCQLTPGQLDSFFDKNQNQLAPDAIYRAKVWGRLETGYQLDFVDAGFLPVIEADAGRQLTALVERTVSQTKQFLGWDAVSDSDGRWLLQSIFWLLAAKILQDKSVRGFVGLDLAELDEVYSQLQKHYHSDGSSRPISIGGQRRREALLAASVEISRFGNCGAVSVEALAFLYESALIDKSTRTKLGTHSTPTWLIDYIIGRLRPWIERDITAADRRVFEPACGHAGFLISAMRLLGELLPADWPQSRKSYLRERLHGLELDPFALEIARLSLTLADVPNPNGWALTEGNMFAGEVFKKSVQNATIVLGNPPFEDFPTHERRSAWMFNKAAETFRRVIEDMPLGGVFGFVLPQTFLHAKQAASVRHLLLRDYEISEINLFADKVFRYGQPESVVIIGRRPRKNDSAKLPITYQRVREWEVEEFSNHYLSRSVAQTEAERFVNDQNCSLLLPDINPVWDELALLPQLSSIADVGQGLSHKGDGDKKLPPGTVKESKTAKSGLTQGFAGWHESQMIHELPKPIWINLNPEIILAARWGAAVGRPQILVNYARISREAWRLKALLDVDGHPVTSDFLVIRPRGGPWSLLSLWALCNSAFANAYAYCHSNKRHILVGLMRQMPIPEASQGDLNSLDDLAQRFFRTARTLAPIAQSKRSDQPNRDQMTLSIAEDAAFDTSSTAGDELRTILWKIDAEVFRLYQISASNERNILDLFSRIRRRGVPFEQTEYFPKGFTELDRLSDLLAITGDWPKTNRRRAKLIDLEEEGGLMTEQAAELADLQRLADARVSLFKPRESGAIDEKIEELKRMGLWTE